MSMKSPSFQDFTLQQGQGMQQPLQQPMGMDPMQAQMLQQQQLNQQQLLQQHGGPLPQGQQQLAMPMNMHTQDNPFAMQKYNNVMFPDVPLQFGGGLTESLLNDNEVPKAIREKYWFVFHKDNTLTFLDEERKRSKLLNFDIAKIDILNTTPYYDYTFDQELQFTVLRNVFETKLDRSLGFKGSAQKNERIVLQSQFSENRNINENEQSNIKEGFFKRLLGRR